MAVLACLMSQRLFPTFGGPCLVSYGFNSPLTLCLLLLTAWGMVGLAGLARPLSIVFVGRTLFPLGSFFGAALAAAALMSLNHPAETLILPLGLPDLPAHLHLDALSSA